MTMSLYYLCHSCFVYLFSVLFMGNNATIQFWKNGCIAYFRFRSITCVVLWQFVSLDVLSVWKYTTATNDANNCRLIPIKFQYLQHSSTLKEQYDLNCVESAVKPQPTNQISTDQQTVKLGRSKNQLPVIYLCCVDIACVMHFVLSWYFACFLCCLVMSEQYLYLFRRIVYCWG